MYCPRITKVIIDYFMTRKPSISRRNRINWHHVRDDVLFSTIKVVSRHQTTQQYGTILPIKLTTDEIRNNKAYKEYYACAMGEATPKPKASTRKKKGESASSTNPPTPTPTTTVESAPRLSATAKGKQSAKAITPTEPTDVQRTEAEQLKIALKRSRQGTHISQQCGFGTDEGTGSSKDDDDNDDEDDDDNDEEEELAKNDEEDIETGIGGNEVSESEGESDEEEIRQGEEGSFDLIPRTPEGSEEESNDEEDQELRLSEEAREFIDVVVRDKHPKPDQRYAPLPPTTIPSIILENLPTFNSAFRFDERLRSLETSFSEYRQTNPFVDAVSVIPGIVHRYMTQQMKEAVREAVQIQTGRLQDSLQRENDEFLRNIDENIKKIIKGESKNQVKEQVSCILPRIEESVNATLEAEVLTQSSHSSRTSYAIAADL
nr:hypothetical protein [Tanacetum cinerariifolium]